MIESWKCYKTDAEIRGKRRILEGARERTVTKLGGRGSIRVRP